MVIESYTSFEELKEACEARHITVKEYEWNDLAVLIYSQLKSDSKDPLVQEARGTIIDKTTMKVVCRPFNKFENYTKELHAANLKDKQYEFRAKLDGSLLKVFYYNDKWWVGTKGEIQAYGVNQYSGFTFISLMFLALGLKNLDEFNAWCNKYLDKDSTHLFEIISPYNKVVIEYEYTALYYLGSVETQTGKHYQLEKDTLPNEVRYPVVLDNINQFTPSVMEDICNACNKSDIEGYILYIDNVPTYKFKTRLYVSRALLNNNGSKLSDPKLITRYLSSIVCVGEIDEWLASYPEHRAQLIEMNDAFHANAEYIARKITNMFIEYEKVEDKATVSFNKMLGLATKDCPLGSAFFAKFKEFNDSFKDVAVQEEGESFEDFQQGLYEYIESLVYDVICQVSGKHQESFIFWKPTH